jgi:uncharacterized RDD family membrane protein YckC
VKSASLTIRTPEGIVFSQTLAGPITRFLAWILDFLCIVVLTMGIGRLLAPLQAISANLSAAVYTICYFLISIGYGIVCEWAWRGQTVGKRLFRLRVMDAEGLRLQFSQIVIRNLLRFVDLLPGPYLLGGVVCLLSPACQRLGDIAGNTIVVRHPRIKEPDLDQLTIGKFNSLRQQPHLAARLRQRVSGAEAALALQSLLRRDEFEPMARVDLFARLADYFRAKVEFPPEAIEGIADEQFLRNVVDIVYRSKTEPSSSAKIAA